MTTHNAVRVSRQSGVCSQSIVCVDQLVPTHVTIRSTRFVCREQSDVIALFEECGSTQYFPWTLPCPYDRCMTTGDLVVLGVDAGAWCDLTIAAFRQLWGPVVSNEDAGGKKGAKRRRRRASHRG